MSPKFWKITARVITAVTAAVVLACALYIMANRLGLVDELDFGAGAYYYTDIPGFEKVIDDDVYKAKLPYWVYVVLFLSWGWLMWRLWIWIDRKK